MGRMADDGGGTATLRLGADLDGVGKARSFVAATVTAFGAARLAADAALCASELVANALLHARTPVTVAVRRRGTGVRVEVHDESDVPVVPVPPRDEAMTGRGLRLVASVADAWGVDTATVGKTVWAEIGTGAAPPPHLSGPQERAERDGGRPVRLVAVPVRLAVATDAHLDDVVRELQLVRSSPGSAPAPVALLEALDEATALLAPSRWTARAAVAEAARAGQRLADVTMSVGEDGVPAFWRLTAVLEQLAQLSRDGELLTPPPTEELSAYRRWLAAEVERQVGGAPPTPCPFPVVPGDGDAAGVPACELLLTERTAREAAERAAARLASLQAVAAGLTRALGTTEVADVVLGRGVAETGARSASLCLLQPDGETVAIVAAAGYSTDVRERWHTFPVSADLPASDAIRTGQAVYLRSAEERDARYPVFRDTPVVDNGAFAIVPLTVQPGRVLGAIAVGYAHSREFGAEDRDFLNALAGLTAQALDRARLHDTVVAAGARFAFLAEASDLLNASLALEDTLRALVALAVPRLGDWCSVHLLEDGEPRFVAAAHVDEDRKAAAEELHRRWPVRLGEAGIGTVLVDGRPALFQVVPEELLSTAARDEEHLAHLRDLGFGSGMAVPLTGGGTVVGALGVANGRGRVVTDEDFALAQDLGARAGAAVVNARLYGSQLHVARALQASLLPARLPAPERLDLAARYRAAGEGVDVGGDFYDAFEAGDRVVLAIGDVCGKGVEAASVTGAARHTIRAVALGEPSPSAVLRRLNDVLVRAAPEVDPGTDRAESAAVERRFCSVALATVEPTADGARLIAAVAGHPPPVVVRAGGAVERVPVAGDLAGLFPSVEVADVEVALGPGDAVVLHTDGVIERRAGSRFFGDEGVDAVLSSLAARRAGAAELAAGLERAALDAFPGEPTDDLAVLVLRVAG
jgi:serine phosphatase RsbU (regulator of sigma subunit)/transcriptional regulator with GAF, ATPase, and Fis domain/anti-sigma regulatory factor (Ser/Thr protein kinase)